MRSLAYAKVIKEPVSHLLELKHKQTRALLRVPSGGRMRDEGSGIELLPRAFPELNPAERFFEELRKELADHVFENIVEVQDYLCKVLKKYYNHPKQIVQLCYHPSVRTT